MHKTWWIWRMTVFLLMSLHMPIQVYGQEDKTAEAISLQDVATEQIDTIKSLINVAIEFIVKYSFQVLGGVIVLFLGWIVAGYVAKFILKFLNKQNIDITVSKFIVGGMKLGVMTFAVIVALGKFGIEIAPLIAGISVIGFGTSFALQGPLSNIAAGISLIFTKPFKVGEIVEVAGVMGEVIDIKLPRTELKTVDGNLVIVPNNHIIGEIIHNYSALKRLDIKVGVSYSSDISKVVSLVRDVIKSDPRVSQEKEIKLGVSEFADSSINIYARIWCKQDDYWDVLFDTNKKIFEAFQNSGVEIPFPQRDVHLIQQKKFVERNEN